MAAVRAKDTQPEMLLRRALHRLGLRYRLHAGHLPGRPDLVFSRSRVAVFVDGDFWHGGGWRERGFNSFDEQFSGHANGAKWREKITKNMHRDKAVNEALGAQGWVVVRLFESEIRRDPEVAAKRVKKIIEESCTRRKKL